ncbi:hypothetical protein PR003_g31416 [Phytophthora rubi]|uniref:Pectate lyase n=1 Tax=Phytophthora rubi TaxID=129364 RepID=A0A6A3GUX2_9STRA|nr:hypothetical protein PR002_g30120 [Phytophthora rubi]KAE9268518.1 hypothetical protein PR003_g31416 [Phytophthora rubi]
MHICGVLTSSYIISLVALMQRYVICSTQRHNTNELDQYRGTPVYANGGPYKC